MNYSRAFTYVFEDKNWLSKILIAGLISLIPIVGQFYLMGWMVEIVRRTKAGRTDILPTTHFSYFLTLGLKLFVVCLIYSIPVIILSCLLGLFRTTLYSSSDSSVTVTVFYTGMGFLGSLLTFIVQVAVALLGTYGTIKLAETDQIKACLDFNDAFNTIKNNFVLFLLVELLMFAAGLIETAGFILCFVGAILTVPYGTAVTGNLAGQLWENMKIGPSSKKPFRGNTAEDQDDIIEEAPFTKVDDIEKVAGPQTENETTAAAPVVNAEAAAAVIDQAKEAAVEKVSEITEQAEESVETASEVIEQAKENTVETVSEIAEQAEESVENAAEIAEQAKSSVEEAAGDAIDSVKDKISEQVSAAENLIEGEKKETNSDNDIPSFE